VPMFGDDEAAKAESKIKATSLIKYVDEYLKSASTKFLSSNEILVGDIFVYKLLSNFPFYKEFERITEYMDAVKTHPINSEN
jgi:glutathione S-transferase